jgi:aspartyl-tRNA(Asn)/glutamyl-tRNA(Gln) amidotransferase subunit A
MRGDVASCLEPAVAIAFEAALAELEAAGAKLVEVELPYYQEAVDVNMIGRFTEGLAYQGPKLREQWDSFQPLTRLRYASGSFFSAADYLRVQRVRRLIRTRVDELLQDVDLVAMPTTGTPAPRVGEGMKVARVTASVFTHYWSTTGHPAVCLPMGFDGELPVSLQLAGRHFEDEALLRVAAAYPERTDWDRRRPPIAADQPA